MRSVVEACWVHSIEIERASFTGNVNSGLSLLAKIRRDGVAECCDGFGLYFRNHGEQMTTRSFAAVKGFADDFENLIFVELARIGDGFGHADGFEDADEFVAVGDRYGGDGLRKCGDAGVHARAGKEIALGDDVFDLRSGEVCAGEEELAGVFGLEAVEDFAADSIVAFTGPCGEIFALHVGDERDRRGFFADQEIDQVFDESAVVGFEAEFVFAGVAARVEEAADVEADERAGV